MSEETARGTMTALARTHLGGGGAEPRVECFDGLSGDTRVLLPLCKGQTPYAMAPSSDGTSVAVGTRAGQVYLLRKEEPCKANRAPLFSQGAPILAMSFVGNEKLAASDAAGRCMLWNTGRPNEAPRVFCRNAVLCALQRRNGRLAGLCEDGRIFSWPLPIGLTPETPETVKAAPPTRPLALIQLVPWPEHQTLVYPGEDGNLVFYECGSGSVTGVPAHDRSFIAITVCDDALVTIGRNDGCLKRWEPSGRTVARTFPAPMGIVCACAVPGNGDCLLLIDERGSGRVYGFNESDLVLRQELPGTDYRVAAGPGPAAILAHRRLQRQSEASRLSAEIESHLRRNDLEGAELLTQQLERLGGFGHVVLAARAHAAAVREDVIEELGLRHELAGALPDAPALSPLLERYASVLERLWCYAEAADVLDRISGLGFPGKSLLERRLQAERFAAASSGNDFIIVPDELATVPVLMKAAILLSKPIRGRYALTKPRSKTCHGARIEPMALVSKYHAMGDEEEGSSRLSAVCEKFYWLTRTVGPREEETTIFASSEPDTRGLELACRLRPTGTDTCLEVSAVFNADKFGGIPSVEERNRTCLAACEALKASESAKTWLEHTYGQALEAVGRLANEQMAQRHAGRNGA